MSTGRKPAAPKPASSQRSVRAPVGRSPEVTDQLGTNAIPLALDGLLTAIVVGPASINPRAWLDRMLADDMLGLRDGPHGGIARRDVIRRHREIADLVSQAPQQLLDDETDIEDWAQGFLCAVKHDGDAWAPLTASDGASALLYPMLVYSRGEDGEPLLDIPARNLAKLKSEAKRQIPNAVAAMRAYWTQRRNA
jgi:uncharacterized protein YecA (UPF0149 family)